MISRFAWLSILGLVACNETGGIDIEAARTGIYEVHTVVVEDSCTWDGAPADYPSSPWRGVLAVSTAQDAIGLPYALQGGAVGRTELRAEDDFAFEYVREQECGSETRSVRLLELTEDTVVSHHRSDWSLDTGCEAELPRPDGTCTTRIEQVMYLEEVCEAPCEARWSGDGHTCVCD